jgi:3-oxoacyl-[acyl-carrier protein] reductase
MNAIHGYSGRAHVSVSKHAAWGFAKALGKEFGPKGITVNCVSPGPISTGHDDPAMTAHIAEMAARVPVGRLGEPEEVAAMVALLASDRGGFINGQLLQVNGGTET